MTPTIDYSSADEIVAKPAAYYRMTRFIMVAAMIGFAPWFAYDGWVNYPKDNEKARTTLAPEPHNDLNILFQKAIAVSMPVLAVALLGWTLYNSRGRYRLAGNLVSIPGHPDVSLDAIRAIDESRWERKGIAYLEYELATGEKGRSRLDDFIYQRPPTDAILERIKKQLLPGGTENMPPDPAQPSELT